MVIKINYTSSDIYVSTNVSPVYVVVNYSAVNNGSGVAWGGITGTLSTQTDLQTALDAKVPYTGATTNVNLGAFTLTAASIIKSGGTSSQFLKADGSVDSTTYVGGSGTSGQVAYWTGASAQTGSNNLFWDAANARLGIGTNAPGYRLHNVGTSAFDAGASNDAITFLNNGYLRMGSTRFRASGNIFQFQDNSYVDKVILNMSGSLSYFNSGGNYVFGGTTDGGQRLQVIGDAFIKGSGNTSATFGLTVQNSDAANLIRARNDGRIILGSQTVNFAPFIQPNNGVSTLNIDGTHLYFGNANIDNANNGPAGFTFDASFSAATGLESKLINLIGTFSGNTTSQHTILRLGYTINQVVGSTGITRGLYVNPTLTSAADWRSIEWSNNTGFGLYGAGTANNYLGGSLGIGITSPTSKLHIIGAGTTSATTPLRISDSAGTLLMQLNDIGHLTLASNQQSKQARIYMTGYNTYPALTISSSSTILSSVDNSNLFFYGDTIRFYNGTGGTEWGRFFNTANLVLQNGGTFTDGGQRLQVQGDAFIKGSGATSATSSLVVQDSAGTAMLTLRNDGVLRVQKSYINLSSDLNNGIGASNDGSSFVSSGGGIMYATPNRTSSGVGHGFYGGNITNTSGEFSHLRTTGRPNFAPTSGTGTFSIAFLEATINQSGGANGITRGLYVNPTLTAAADWRSIEWSNNSGWGLYGAGTANNYLGGSLGIGSASLSNANLAIEKNISGSTSAYGVLVNSVIQSGVTANAYGFRSILTTQAASFTLSNIFHFVASQTTQGAGSIVTTQIGYECGDMNNGYTNIAYRGQISQGTLSWNLYMNGTASNYLAGQLLIGTTTKGTFALDVNGTARVSDSATFTKAYTNTSDLGIIASATTAGINLRSPSNGRTSFMQNYVLVGTSSIVVSTGTNNPSSELLHFNANDGTVKVGSWEASTGEKFQINGNARIKNKFTFTGGTTLSAQINLESSTAPTSPVNGDIWFDGTDLKMTIGGVTKTFTLV